MKPAPPASGILFVLSAPSGTGKSTLARRLLAEDPELVFSVSTTTRPRREGEQEGREYHFVDEPRFEAMEARGEFLESARVHGRRYGTGREQTQAVLASGRDLLLDIDVQGARRLREGGAVGVFLFVLPPDYETLARRLRERRTESATDMAERLSVARREVEEYPGYDYLTINDDLERAFQEIRSVVRAERAKVARRALRAQGILGTFPRS